jgi:hypothetical protein
VKPSLPTALTTAAALLAAAAGGGADESLDADLPFLRMVLVVAAREYEQCAARRVAEIAGLTGLLARGASLPGCPVPAPEPVGGLLETDLRISALDARLDTLRGQLIGLQAWLEDDAGSADAAALREEITGHLYETARRHAATLSSR